MHLSKGINSTDSAARFKTSNQIITSDITNAEPLGQSLNMSMSSFLTSSTLKRSDLGLNYQTAFYDAISAAHALSFIRSHQLKRRAGRTCWTRRLPRSNLLPKPNSEMITPTLAVEANFRLNSVAHVRRNCQTTTADHPLGLRELCKTKQERNSRRGTEFHPQGDGRRKRFRRPQGVNLSIF